MGFGKWVGDRISGAGDAVESFGNSVSSSVDNIVDSGGDFLRAVGRGDFESAGSDLASIGWEATNIVSGGTLNIVTNAIRRNLLPDFPETEYSDRKVMARSAGEPRRIVYGKTRVGGVVRYIESSGDDSQTMHVILIFAAHSCADIERIYFNDELAFIGTTAQGKFSGKASVIFETGKQTAANSAIVASTPSGWTDSHKLLGQTYAYFKLEYDNDVYQGLPNIDALIIGNDEIYDPRTGQTGWSDNQALITLDWIRKSYGYNEQKINEQSFIDGANYCDDLMAAANGTTEKRYTCSGSIAITEQPLSGLDAINAAGASSTIYHQGEIYYVPGVYEAPDSQVFTERDFFGGIQVIPTIGATERLNTVTGTFIDPANNYEQNDFVPLAVDEYIATDKQELKTDSKFPFADSQTKARRLAKIYMEQSRYGVSLSGRMSFAMLAKKYGDRIKISIDRLGWDERVFRLVSMEIGLTGVDVVLQEDSPDIWGWEAGDALVVDVPPALDIPDGSYTSTPTGLSASESLYIANDKTTVRSRIKIVWDGSATTRNYEIEGSYSNGDYQTLSDYLTAPVFTFDDAQVGQWVFRVRSRNNVGFYSDWAYLNFTSVGKTAPPADVFAFVGDVNPFAIDFEWQPVPDLDLFAYELRLGSDWDTATHLQTIKATRWQWELRPSGQEQVLIKAIDTTGNYSLNATPVVLDVDPPGVVDPLTVDVIDNNVLLRWHKPSGSFAIDFYEIRRGDTIENSEDRNTVKGTFSNQFEEVAGEFRYWVRAVDVQGNAGEWQSVLADVDTPPDYVLQSDAYMQFRERLSCDDNETTCDNNTITCDQVYIGKGTTTNMFLRANPAGSVSDYSLVGPVDLTETVEQHFDALPGATINDKQAGNGYPIAAQPTLATGSYVQTIDYEGLLGTSRITLTPDVTVLAGSPSVTYKIAYSPDNVTFTEITGTTTVASNFRYVRVTIEVSAPSTQDLIVIESLRVKLNVKVKTDQFKGVADAGDVGGTFVPFNVPFVDVISISPNPNTTSNVTAVHNFTDVPNPTGFRVLLFDSDTGNRVSGPFSGSVRGV